MAGVSANRQWMPLLLLNKATRGPRGSPRAVAGHWAVARPLTCVPVTTVVGIVRLKISCRAQIAV
jgi:hypothetical protein